MAAAKKGKKTSKNKKASKGNKKNNNLNFFSKIMLTLLTTAVVITAVFLTLGNFNMNKNQDKKPKTEVVADKQTKEERRQEVKKETKEVKNETVKEEVVKEDAIKEEVVKEEPKQQKENIDLKKEMKESKTLNGCWLSSEQGASITIDEFGYRIDFFGVDASQPITGEYHFDNNLIVFTTDGNICDNIEGYYRITFYKNNFSLICKDDECSKRRNILEADWEWMEI